MRGMRRLTLVPSVRVSTSSDTGTGLSLAAYFGFAIFEGATVKISRSVASNVPPGSGALMSRWLIFFLVVSHCHDHRKAHRCVRRLPQSTHGIVNNKRHC